MRRYLAIFICLVMVSVLFCSCVEVGNNERDDKPVIYLYPEETIQVDVTIDLEGEMLYTYPDYKEGWQVIAEPSGRLTNIEDNHEYSYLFWEGSSVKDWEIEQGFVVKGIDTASFLQEKLAYLGLEPKEYNEFIVYWLPKMQDNPYNLIYFAGSDYTETAKLTISPEPDSLLRVFMVFEPLEASIEIEEQVLESFIRDGFTVIEWGGTEILK